mmetsp:Transcript_19336/g.61646  ORF Transcript_19336/g.61646 Transcript_19336/m.61646 type:complete len:200 (+) Transcript_19336:750-1349(+)
MTSGPRRWTKRRLRILPLPARIVRDATTLSTSTCAPTLRSKSTAFCVLAIDSTEASTTRGHSGVSSTRWPRAITSGVTPDAAIAEHAAYRFCVTLIFACHLRHVLVGANMRPPRHMLPYAPWPERCVPPPCTRGMRDTARPVPHEDAAHDLPAYLLTEYGCRLFLERATVTWWTTSGRTGARKTPGSATLELPAAPSAP